ncbi:histidine phosphatase family protein [Thomasclavelia spiroformis]|uniref:histidine phosphatase family protein n=1 Tax=Thomasclavelia spiroformis TaxID=29348 RepID=UPI00255BDD1F|nr:histidine phosphatase family protein [Thomasclavelia spiroformis]
MSLYITRHGETDYNIKELVCGISEAMLSDKGIKQAQKLADLLRNIDYKFLYVSPLQRAIDTANYANVYQVEMIIEPRIREFNFGKCEGVYRRDEKFLEIKHNLAYRYPGGESFVELCKRVYEFLDEIKQQAIENDVLLVCHGGVCRAIHSYFNDMTNDEIFNYQMDNCKLLKYDFKND